MIRCLIIMSELRSRKNVGLSHTFTRKSNMPRSQSISSQKTEKIYSFLKTRLMAHEIIKYYLGLREEASILGIKYVQLEVIIFEILFFSERNHICQLHKAFHLG